MAKQLKQKHILFRKEENRMAKMKKAKRRNTENYGYIFILPWLVGFLLLTAYPIFYSLYLSFFNVTITTTGIQTKSVGMSNFQQAVTGDIEFINRVVAFVQEIVIAVPLIVILALLIALLLHQDIKFKGVFRTIFFLPVIISSGPVLEKLINLDITTIPGLDNYAIYDFVVNNTESWVAQTFTYILNNIIILLWFSGVQILIFISALQKVDKQVYEAAAIDGASAWERFWKITLPTLFPMIFVNLVYTTVMYSVSSMNVIIGHIQSHMFRLETGFGYASAMSWIYFVIIALILVVFSVITWFFNRKNT